MLCKLVLTKTSCFVLPHVLLERFVSLFPFGACILICSTTCSWDEFIINRHSFVYDGITSKS